LPCCLQIILKINEITVALPETVVYYVFIGWQLSEPKQENKMLGFNQKFDAAKFAARTASAAAELEALTAARDAIPETAVANSTQTLMSLA